MFYKGRNRFLLFCDQGFHSYVTNHEVCSKRILIQQKCICTHLKSLQDICSLRRTPACVSCRKFCGILIKWKIRYKGINVQVLDAATVLRPYLDGIGTGHHKLASIIRYMVIDSIFQCIQEC